MNTMNPDVNTVMNELEQLGSAQTKKTYINHGAREPLFGVTTGSMKPLSKKIKRNYQLSMALFATGNYDAMYFAGMIADPALMTKADFNTWIENAYCYGIADYTVAVTLAESDLAQEIADEWIKSDQEMVQSAGWACYEWLLGVKPDSYFDRNKIKKMLDDTVRTIHTKPDRVRYAMNNFSIAVGISYLPLHEEAVQAAKAIGKVSVDMGSTSCKVPLASDYIQRAVDKGRIGFKRRNVRC